MSVLGVALCGVLCAAAHASGGVDSGDPQGTTRPRLVVVPLGLQDPSLAELVAQVIRKNLAYEVEVHAPLPLFEAAWYAPRKRWRAEILLDHLAALDTGGATKVVGITSHPISTTKGDIYDWGIAGLGSMSGASCVLTSYLFRKLEKRDRDRFVRYLENFALHEVGHTLGLPHCERDSCIMADAKGNAIRSAEKSDNRFCPVCAKKLGTRLLPFGSAAPGTP